MHTTYTAHVSVQGHRHAVAGSVRYALSDDRVCLPPATTPFRAMVTVR